MHDPRLLIALALILGGLIAFDHLRTKTGGVVPGLARFLNSNRVVSAYFHSDWTVLFGFCLE